MRGRAGGDHGAPIHHRHDIRNIHNDFHVVLDQYDRNLTRVANIENEAGEIAFFVGAHAGHRLVHDQHPGTQRQRPAEVDALAHAIAKTADVIVAKIFKLEKFDDLLGFSLEALFFGAGTRPVEERIHQASTHVHMQTGEHILAHSHGLVSLDALKRAADAGARSSVRRLVRDVLAIEQKRRPIAADRSPTGN